MTSARKARSLAVALALFTGVTLAGCAASPESTGEFPTDAPEQSATATPTPEQTVAPAEPTESASAFTPSALAQICIDATVSAFDPDVEFDASGVRVEPRTVTPEWLVLVPAVTMGYSGEAQCTIGGSPTDPDVDMAAASIERLPEEQIQRLIRGENEGNG
jgi:ABC-type transport system substrate-binding protein